MMERRHYPTLEELHAIEQAAKRARAEAIARAFVAAMRGIRTLVARGAAVLARDFHGTDASSRRGV